MDPPPKQAAVPSTDSTVYSRPCETVHNKRPKAAQFSFQNFLRSFLFQLSFETTVPAGETRRRGFGIYRARPDTYQIARNKSSISQNLSCASEKNAPFCQTIAYFHSDVYNNYTPLPVDEAYSCREGRRGGGGARQLELCPPSPPSR
ncbi:unnamed protein product [Ectocarpus sp. 4 AP-2014]